LISKLSAAKRDPLHRNAFFLMLNQAALGLTGYIYWFIAARHAAPAFVSSSLAALGIIGLLGTAVTLGLPSTLMRFWSAVPSPTALLAKALSFVAGAGLALSGLWLLLGHIGLPRSSPSVIVFLAALAIPIAGVGTVSTFALIARQQASRVLLKDSIATLAKFALLLLFIATIGLSTKNIVTSSLAALITAAALATILALRPTKPRTTNATPPSSSALLRFSLGNHIAALVASAPPFVFPAILVAILGPTKAAFVTIPLMIVTALTVIPQSISNSLLTESSRDQTKLPHLIWRSVKSIYILAIPAVAVVFVAAPYILHAFGPGYASGSTCLRFMTLAILVMAANYVSDTVLLAHTKTKAYMVVNILGTIAVVGATVVGATHSVSATGIGWAAGQSIYLLLSVIALFATRITSKDHSSLAPQAPPRMHKTGTSPQSST